MLLQKTLPTSSDPRGFFGYQRGFYLAARFVEKKPGQQGQRHGQMLEIDNIPPLRAHADEVAAAEEGPDRLAHDPGLGQAARLDFLIAR